MPVRQELWARGMDKVRLLICEDEVEGGCEDCLESANMAMKCILSIRHNLNILLPLAIL